MSGTYFTLNQKYNQLKTEAQNNVTPVVPIPTSSTLADVLLNGNSAGATDLDMNTQDILQVNNIDLVTINGSAYPPTPATPTLSDVLTAGNTATNSIALNNSGTGTNVINLLPNAGASDPQITLTDGTTTNTINKSGYTTRNSVQNTTHYLNFSDSSATGTGAIQKTAGISCNPSTNTITATTFIGDLSGNATSATNIAGGIASQIPYQSSANTTAFIPNGTAGQVLTSAGTGVPTWTTPSAGGATIDITDTNTSATYYPTFVSASGSAQTLRADTTTTPWSINPNTGVFNFANTLSVGGGASNNNVYIGRSTGTNGTNITAVGQNARGANNGGVNGTAVGVNAGYNSMGDRAVCLGAFAGNSATGTGAVCIGYNAGGSFTVPAGNIIIDADLATNITASGGTNRFFVNPIRSATQTTALGYDTTTKEITYYTPTAVSNASNVASQIYASDFPSTANADYAGFPLFSTITESGSIAQTAYAGRFGVRRFATATAPQSASKMVSSTNGSQPNLTLSMISQDTSGLGWTIIFNPAPTAGFYQFFGGFFTTATQANTDWSLDYPRAVIWRTWTDTGDWACKLGNAPTQYFTGSGTASNNFIIGRIVPTATGVSFYLYNQSTSTNYTPITILYSATSGGGLVSATTGFYYGFQVMNAQSVTAQAYIEVDFIGFQLANNRIYP